MKKNPKFAATCRQRAHGRLAAKGVALLALLGGVAACGAEEFVSDSADVVEVEESHFEHYDTLDILLIDSPSDDEGFTFCDKPASDLPVHLTNVAWLNFMAANEYAHFGYFGPQLYQLGFHTPDPEPGSVETMWQQCAIDLAEMRTFERPDNKFFHAAFRKGLQATYDYLNLFLLDGSEQWGPCAQKWFRDSDYDGTEYPSASMERWLTQDVHLDAYVQFFTGGKASDDGRTFDKDSTQAVFMRHSTLPVAIIAFRGTEPPANISFSTLYEQLADIGVNLAAWQHKIPNWGSAHAGMLSQFRSLEHRLLTKINELDPETQIWITGHSLGGGLATFMAMRLLDDMNKGKERNFKGVVTFGSPRVGNHLFEAAFNRAVHKFGVRSVRVRNHNDIVTRLPPALHYRHVNQLLFLTPNALSLPSSLSPAPSYNGFGSIDDHLAGFGYYDTLIPLIRDGAYATYDRCDG